MTEIPAGSHQPTPWLQASDYRHALELLIHSATGDALGIKALFAESDEVKGASRMMAALVRVVFTLAPELGEPDTLEEMRKILLRYALMENENDK